MSNQIARNQIQNYSFNKYAALDLGGVNQPIADSTATTILWVAPSNSRLILDVDYSLLNGEITFLKEGLWHLDLSVSFALPSSDNGHREIWFEFNNNTFTRGKQFLSAANMPGQTKVLSTSIMTYIQKGETLKTKAFTALLGGQNLISASSDPTQKCILGISFIK